jgi:two-component sensor histidine kinase
MLLSEMSHRVANSLQIIASILLMKARRGIRMNGYEVGAGS